jgi:acyl-CoA thioesterase-1
VSRQTRLSLRSRTQRLALIGVAALACIVMVGTGYVSARAAVHEEARLARTAASATEAAATPDLAQDTPTPASASASASASVSAQDSASQPRIPAPVSGPVVVAIGDSIMEGHGLASDRAWLALLASEKGWQLTNLASDGSGFVAVGSNGDTFADQAAAAELLHPDVVVFSGSSNDLGVSDSRIDSATATTIAGLHAALPNTRIVSISAMWGDTDVPGQLSDIDSAVENATIAAGGTYLDASQPLAGDRAAIQTDQVHPTADGQLMIARAVQAAMLSAGVTF